MPPNASADPNSAVLSVTSLNRLVRETLEANFPPAWVGGEISNLTYAASGHLYFSLKDAGAQVRCVMWRSRAQLLGRRLENGQKVEVRALVSFYEPRGEFQLSVESVRLAGQGDLYERFLRLKAMLEGEGLFAMEKKRLLPAHPQALAIVTSPQAAALRDVLTTLRRRAPHVRIDIYPAPVQGEGAAVRIAAAIAAAAAGDCDAIIVCRGGGSIEDLWAFNEEVVARAIRASRLPVVSGVGHETDFTIADFAADMRAPTPTAAAELLSPDREALVASLALWWRRLARQGERDLAERNQQLDWLASRLLHPAERLRERREALVGLRQRMARAATGAGESGALHLNVLAHRLRRARLDTSPVRAGLHHLGQRLDQAVRQQIARSEGKLNGLAGGLIQLDPHAVLRRGYAIALASDGRAVRDAAGLHPGSHLNLTFARGQAVAAVTQVVPNDEDQ